MRRSAIVVVLLVATASVASCGGDDITSGVATSFPPTGAAASTSVSDTEAPESETSPASTAAITEPSPAAIESSTTESPTIESSASTEVGADRAVVSFSEPASIEGWSNVDDTVMGGVSASTTSWEDGRMVFSGDLSLDNNGGFTSVRSPQDAALGSGFDDAGAIGVVAEGDGKTYVLQLRTADEGLYIARFVTVDGEEQRYELSLNGFEPVTRFLDPDPGAPPLEPSSVVQLAIYLLDGQVGPFRLAVSAIEAIAPAPF